MARVTRNFYVLLFLAIFIIMSFLLYGRIDSSESSKRASKDAEFDAQMRRLRDKVSDLERTLARNGDEMGRIRAELVVSERKRKELIDKQIEKENEIYDEKAEAHKDLEKTVNKAAEEGDGGGEHAEGGDVEGEEGGVQAVVPIEQHDDKEKDEEDKAVVPIPESGGNKAAVVRRFLNKKTSTPALPALRAPETDTCPLRINYSIPHSDVQMLDMYDVIKFDNPDGGVWKQGWQINYDAGAVASEPQLEIIVVPHSHCDPGWIKTFDQYFEQQTRHILDQMSQQLLTKTEMSFIYAEISFFELWWAAAEEPQRQAVKDMLDAGRLEIVTGGWVMTDEANAHFYSIITELIEGHEWIKNHLGTDHLPKTHWSIDPFGLSPSLPQILAAANITRAAIQRVHYSVKKQLAKQKQLEFAWRQLWAGDSAATDVETHLFPFYSYDVPHTCGPDPKICCQFDFRRLGGGGMSCPWGAPPVIVTTENVAARANLLYDQYRKKSQLYKTNALLIPLGDDFRYDSEFEWNGQYENYKALFEYMNKQKEWNVKARFGTLSDYFTTLDRKLGEANEKLPTLTGDFFTYADRDDHYWSGYFTSRPFYKQLDRVLQHYLRAADISYTLARMADSTGTSLTNETFQRLVSARRALSLFQHHDGVTGTAKDDVVADYGERMLSALLDCEEVLAVSAEALLQKKGSAPGQMQIDETRGSQDALAEKRVAEVGSSLILFNSLAQRRNDVACVRVADVKARVRRAAVAGAAGGSEGRPQQQISPVLRVEQSGGEQKIVAASDEFELCFEADVGPFSLVTYNIVSETANDKEKATVRGNNKIESSDFGFSELTDSAATFELRADSISATFDSKTGLLQSVTPAGGNKLKTALSFQHYGARGHKKINSGGGDDLSGAYLFLPDGPAKPLPAPKRFVIIEGALVKRVVLAGPADIQLIQTYTLEKGQPFVDITNEVDIRAKTENFEVSMRIESGVESADTVYTDLNALQMIRRRRQLDKLPLQAHVYPMSSAAFIEDSQQRLSLLGAQALGVSSLQSGWLEVILERRLFQDDGRGVAQGVLDNKRTLSHFRLLPEMLKGEATDEKAKTGFLSSSAHSASRAMHYPFVKLLSEDSDLSPSFSGMTSSLPCDVHIVAFRSMAGKTDYTSKGPTTGSKSARQLSIGRRATGPEREAALILHRPLGDCRFQGREGECGGGSHQMNPSVLFGASLKKAEPATLTMLYESGKPAQAMSLEPQELKTYKISF